MAVSSLEAQSPSTCLRLLAATSPLTLHYLAEGAANVVYSVTSLSTPQNDHYAVMRLRKALTFTQPCAEALSAFEQRITPLFTPDHSDMLMPQTLYKLTPGMVADANAVLKMLECEGRRPKERIGAFLPPFEVEECGILMPNLGHGRQTQLLEFKPKWLVQSPSAPDGARRCRTCALNAARREEGKAQGRGDSGFCPLDLLSGDGAILREALRCVYPGNDGLEEYAAAFREKVQPALKHLQALQAQYGEVGLLDFQNPDGKDFSIAMALRDCSVFLEVSGNGKYVILDVKFADLDLKSTDGGKLEKWAAMEESLISTSAYVKQFKLDDNCALGRSSSR